MPPRTVRRARKKISYQWCGHNELYTVQTSASTNNTDIMLLCPSLGNPDTQQEVVIKRIIIKFQTRRVGTGAVEGYGWAIAIQRVVPSTGVPLEQINPLDVVADNFTLASKDAMGFGLLNIPASMPVGNSASTVVSQRLMLDEIDLRSSRVLPRANHALTLNVVADANTQVKCFVQSCVLVAFR